MTVETVSSHMAVQVTTISVHPDRADGLRDFRDENDFGSLDAALAELLSREGE